MTSKRKFTALVTVSGLAVAAAGFAFIPLGDAPADGPAEALPDDARVMHVSKSPSCGCCGAWVGLAREQGFRVEVENTEDYAGMKQAASVPEEMWACHTAQIAGYTVEGHVPFGAIRKLLDERPDIDGIAVPGMPAGAPGMGSDPDAVFGVIAYGGAAGDGAVFQVAGR